jgi:hypothetical protein
MKIRLSKRTASRAPISENPDIQTYTNRILNTCGISLD